MSVTIISENSIDADAFSTAVFAMGLKEGMDFIEEKENLDAVFLTKDYRVYVTSGIQQYNFTIVDKQFQLGNNIK